MSWRRRAPYLAYRAMSATARALPEPAAAGTARALGLLLSRVMTGRRAMIARHLRRVGGGAPTPRALDRSVRAAFDSYARYWMESFRLPGSNFAELDAHFAHDGLRHIDEGLAAGNGVILAVPHLGGWDYAGAWLAARGTPITAVVEPVEPPELFAWFAELRRGLGMHVVALGPEAGPAVLRALRENRIVALLCDRDIAGGGIEVDFFGERTTVPAGPATLALRTGAPVLPTAIYFEGRRDHLAVVRPPLDATRTGRFRDDVARITQDLAHELEDLVRRAPEQWHLFQPNWPSDLEA